MVTVKGLGTTRAKIAGFPAKLERIALGAARAAGQVYADEVGALTPSDAVKENLRVQVRSENGHVTVRVDVAPGWARSLGTWLEWGTSPHFISVDDSQRAGKTVQRINRLAKAEGANHSLVIGGQFVGQTVFHPGSRPHPTFRTVRDTKADHAIAAAQAFIDRRGGGK